MKNRFSSLAIALIISLLQLFTSCASPVNSQTATKKIVVGAGPEDMVIERSTGTARLLISCASRRTGEAPFGEIVSYTPSTGVVDTLLRVGMPDSLYFQPHGIFLDSLSSPQLLYVISHEHEKGFHPVYIWEIDGEKLIFRELAFSPLVHSPNALTLGSKGEIYIVNDSGKRGSMLEKIFKLNRANIVLLSRISENHWEGEVVAEKLGYPAGINRIGNILYAGDAIKHRLHRYSIGENGLTELEPIKGLRGNDNIRVINGRLYLTGHVKPFKFISHVKSSEKLSPVEVWEVYPETGEIKSLFYNNGSIISAGSTAVVLNGKLYVCQVFDPFIVEIALEE